jgi:hypothetical protein
MTRGNVGRTFPRPDVLAWTPQTSRSDGLVRTIEYFEELLSNEAIRPFILHELRAKA